MFRAAALGAALLLGAETRAIGQSLDWAKQAGGPNFDQGQAIAVDDAGNSYVTGIFTGSATFGPGEPGEITLVAFGRDVFVAKYDAAGNFLWARQASSTDGQGHSIAVDPAGNSYVAGEFRFGLGFEDGTVLSGFASGEADLFVAKYDTNGNLMWARQAGPDFIPGVTDGGKAATGIAVDAAGSSHVTGIFGTPDGTNAFFVAKYDTNGALLWAKDAGAGGLGATSYAAGIAIDGSGHSFVTGSSQPLVTQPVNLVVNGSFEEPPIAANSFQVFNSLPGWTQSSGFTGIEVQRQVAGTPFDGNQLVELDSFTPTGISQEVPTQPGRSYQLSFAFSPRPGTGATDNVLRVMWGGEQVAVLSADGTTLADTNWTVHTFTVAGGPGATTTLTFEDLGVSNTLGTYIDAVSVVDLSTQTTFGFFLAAFDDNGTLMWVRRAVGDVRGNAVSVDAAGNPYVTGDFSNFYGSVVFGAGEVDETTLVATSRGDLFVVKYDNDGHLIWARQSSGPGIKGASGISVDSAGNAHISGAFVGVAVFGAGEANEATLASTAQGADALVATYDASGAVLWARQTTGPYVAIARGIDVDVAGNAYIAGLFGNFGGNAGDPTSVVFGPGEPHETTLTTGVGSGSEIFLARYANGLTRPNRPPVAVDEEATTLEDTPLAITLAASDADGDTLTYEIVPGPIHGVLTGTAPELIYTPSPDYFGVDAFTFRAFDGTDFSNGATVSITISPVNDPPVAPDQTVTTPQNVPVAIVLAGSDVDGDTLTFSVVDPPAHGSLSGIAPALTYTPQQDYVGPDSFTFRAFDGALFSAAALVALSVEPASLVCGALVSGRIDAPREIDTYTFAGQAGQIISLALANTGGFLSGVSSSALLTLLAPSGVVVGAFRSNGQMSFVLPVTGRYVVRVNATNLTTIGSYNVNMECLFPTGPDTVPLTCGTRAAGRIEAPGDVDLYSFSGQAGQTISLALANTGGFLSGGASSALLTLFAPSGVEVGAFRSNNQVIFTLPVTGLYVIRVNATNLTTIGSYNVNLECLIPTGPETVPLMCGMRAAGRIEAPGDVDLYSFSGQAGQIVSLALANTGGFLSGGASSALLTLFAPSGVEVGAFRSNNQVIFTLPVTGLYVIRVNATNLTTIGSYNVNLECLIPNAPGTIPLMCGTRAAGRIEAPGDVDLYSFSGQTGQIISLALANTGGFGSGGASSALLTLFAPSGVEVGAFRSNNQVIFTLPVTGLYVIRVNATNLMTTGSYNVNLECLVPPSPDTVALTCGMLAPGAIEAPGDVDLFSFAGQTGQIISLALANAGGFGSGGASSALLTLFAPSGVEVGAFRSNAQVTFTLPVTGPYVIRVNATNLITVGSYQVRLNCS